jgi:hypothetical protein
MADKSIIISEQDILERFDQMCAESLDSKVYVVWKHQIIPALNEFRDELKKKKKKTVTRIGPLKISIGEFTIREMDDPPGESVWIEVESGEGGEFRKDRLEPLIKKFFWKNM